MASLEINFGRPCWVKEKRAMFHCWSEVSQIVPPSPMMGGYPGGVISNTYGVVEFEDGRVKRVEPESIRFVNIGHFHETYFGEVDNENN